MWWQVWSSHSLAHACQQTVGSFMKRVYLNAKERKFVQRGAEDDPACAFPFTMDFSTSRYMVFLESVRLRVPSAGGRKEGDGLPGQSLLGNHRAAMRALILNFQKDLPDRWDADLGAFMKGKQRGRAEEHKVKPGESGEDHSDSSFPAHPQSHIHDIPAVMCRQGCARI